MKLGAYPILLDCWNYVVADMGGDPEMESPPDIELPQWMGPPFCVQAEIEWGELTNEQKEDIASSYDNYDNVVLGGTFPNIAKFIRWMNEG